MKQPPTSENTKLPNKRPPTMDCEHRWGEPDTHHGPSEMVVTFDCEVCTIHVACGVDDPNDYQTGEAVLCGDGIEYELCMGCNMVRDQPYLRDDEQCQCWECSVCGVMDDGMNVTEDWCQTCENKEE